MIKQRKPEVVEFLNKTITHPQFNTAIDHIALIHKTYGFQPAGMMLVGDTGLGKTTLLEYYRNKANGNCQGSFDLPVLIVNIPAAATGKQVLLDAVEALGGQIGTRPTEAELNRMLRKLLRSRNTSLVIFDEFQHFAAITSVKSVQQTGNTIKNLMTDTKIPFVLAGLPESKVILERHPELKRRFTQTIELKPLRVHSEHDLTYFRNYLLSIEKAIMDSIKGEVSGFATVEMASRFWLASGGMLAAITRIVEFAMEVANLDHCISQEDLAAGYRLFNPMGSTDEQNPFLMKNAALSKAMGVAK